MSSSIDWTAQRLFPRHDLLVAETAVRASETDFPVPGRIDPYLRPPLRRSQAATAVETTPERGAE